MSNKAARTLGKLGGKARARKLTPERRTEIARQAAVARWSKVKSQTKPQPGAGENNGEKQKSQME